MIHSFLIVGGTKKKRFRTTQKTQWVSDSDNQNIRGSDLSDVPTHRRTDAPSYSEFSGSLKFDTTLLEPEEDKQTIAIEQIRDLRRQLSLKPHSAKFKTGIILEAQRMTIEAQNALLKTLEEPPAHSVLILTAPSTKTLLPTTVSRCQIVRLPAEIDLDIKSEEHKKTVEEFLELLGAGRGERLAWVEENKKTINDQHSIINSLDIWTSVLRDLLLTNSGCQNLTLNSFNGPSNSSNSLKPPTSKLVKSILLCSSILFAQKTKNLIAKTNVSARLALEVLLLDLPILQE